jgi:hypothetical protein
MSSESDGCLEGVRDELRNGNRLMVLSLVRAGIKQKDIAATLLVSEGTLSKWFPGGLLKRVAQLSKRAAVGEE